MGVWLMTWFVEWLKHFLGGYTDVLLGAPRADWAANWVSRWAASIQFDDRSSGQNREIEENIWRFSRKLRRELPLDGHIEKWDCSLSLSFTHSVRQTEFGQGQAIPLLGPRVLRWTLANSSHLQMNSFISLHVFSFHSIAAYCQAIQRRVAFVFKWAVE